jgi:hypothetical protein
MLIAIPSSRQRRLVEGQTLTILLVLGLTLAACGPKPPPPDTTVVSPKNRSRLTPQLKVANVQKDQFDLIWKVDRNRTDLIRGYNVYVSEDGSVAGLSPDSKRLAKYLYQASTYPGDTDGDIRRESITVERVEPGVRYYVHVRTVFPNGEQSPPSEELDVIPRPRGRIVLSPRFSGGDDGFSFRRDKIVPPTSEANDLYLYTTTEGFFLASPSRLDQGLRETRFVDLGPSDSLDDYPRLERPWTGEERIGVEVGHSIGLILDDEHLAKLRPVAFESSSEDRPQVVFEYVYQPVKGESSF